jgi:hypothetical protein
MKGFIVLTLGLLVSIAPLYAKEGQIIRKAKDRQAQVIPQERPAGQQEELAQEGPAPLTEEEQVSLIKGMNLPDMESDDEAAPKAAD